MSTSTIRLNIASLPPSYRLGGLSTLTAVSSLLDGIVEYSASCDSFTVAIDVRTESLPETVAALDRYELL